MEQEQSTPESNDESLLSFVKIIPIDKVASLTGKEAAYGVEVAIISDEFEGSMRSLIKAIVSHHPNISTVIMEKPPKPGTTLISEEVMPKKFEIKPMAINEVIYADKHEHQPWKNKGHNKNNYKSKLKKR